MSTVASEPSLDPVARRDRRTLYATGFVRALSTALVGVLLGVYLGRLGLHPAAVGAVITGGLAGATLAALVVTFAGDRLGRRRVLVALAVLNLGGALVLAAVRAPWALGLAAFAGALNGMGRDRGGALVLELAALPAAATDATRTAVIARYTMLQDMGHALGSLAAGLPALIHRGAAGSSVGVHRGLLVACAVLGGLSVLLYRRLSPRVEDGARGSRAPMAPASRRIVARLAALFAVDSLGGGFLTTAMLGYFFFERFGAGEGVIAVLFFAARAANALSHLGAAWLARRIGLVNTMVFTHLPSSLLLVTVAVAPNFLVAALLFLLREGLVEMDVPTRQSYVLAVVAPAERTRAAGITNLVRLAGWAVAPGFAGLFMQRGALVVPLVVGAGLKIAYDVALYVAFRSLPPPEERAVAAQGPTGASRTRP